MAEKKGAVSTAASFAAMLTPTPVKTPFSHAQIVQFALEEQRRDKSLELFKRPTELTKKRKKQVLEEEDYVTRLGSIIRRDYFPDIERLQAKADYLQALERNDVAKIRELQVLYTSPLASLRANKHVPATPTVAGGLTSRRESERRDKSRDDVLTPRIPRTDSDADVLAETETADNGRSSADNAAYDDFIPLGKSAVTPSSASMAADSHLNRRPSNSGDGSDDGGVTLSSFQSTFTSEDNASFDDIQNRDEQRRQEKYSWMYKIADKNSQLVITGEEEADVVQGRKALPDIRGPDVPANAVEFEPDLRPNRIELWAHKPHNTVMFKPVAAPLSNAEVDELLASKVHVNHANTRFTRNVWKNKHQGGQTPTLSLANSSSSLQTTDKQQISTRETISLAPAAAANNIKLASIQPRIGVDGGLVHAGGNLAAAAGGRTLISDPSPVPGIIDASPIITWGEIEGTPLALAGDETPLGFPSFANTGDQSTNGQAPHYTVQKMSNRDQLHLDMIDDIAKRRKYEREAVKPAITVAKKAGLGLSGELGRFSNMSSAAQRLATQKLRIGTPMRSSRATKAFPSPAGVSSVRSNATPVFGNLSSRSSVHSSSTNLALNVKRAK